MELLLPHLFCLLTQICFQERIQINKILSNAQEWGVKILYIDGVLLRFSLFFLQYIHHNANCIMQIVTSCTFYFLDVIHSDIMAYLKRKKRVVSSQCPAATAVKINVSSNSEIYSLL